MSLFRVVTINCDETVSIMTGWKTYRRCKLWILGRWGHWPPFVVISKIDDKQRLENKYGGKA